MTAASTPSIWLTGSQDECCKAAYWQFFLARCRDRGVICREFDMKHEDLRGFIGGFHLAGEAEKFYKWLGGVDHLPSLHRRRHSRSSDPGIVWIVLGGAVAAIPAANVAFAAYPRPRLLQSRPDTCIRGVSRPRLLQSRPDHHVAQSPGRSPVSCLRALCAPWTRATCSGPDRNIQKRKFSITE